MIGRGGMRLKWIRRIVVYALFVGLLAGLPGALKLTQSPPDGLAARRYEGYAGVLTLWLCEDWSGGRLCAWLNRCLTAFEKAHKGVYVQLTQVSRTAMTQFAAAQTALPDALIFSPGLLHSAQGLAPLEEQYGLRESLTAMGETPEGLFALPVALGGYGFAYNRALLGAVPNDWSALELSVPPLNAPLDDEDRSWSAALIALFAGTYATQSGAPPLAGEGLDLGLPTHTPAAQATAQPTLHENALPTRLPEDFRQTESVYSAFTRGQAAAIPVTQRELHRLTLLSDQGKGPDYAVSASGAAFTDQAALFAISELERNERASRIALCRELLSCLLSDEMQEKLTLGRAFRVTEGAPLYAAPEMRALETQLARADLCVPPAFSNDWRQTASSLCDRMQAGELSPREAFRQLYGALSPGAD